MKENTPNKDEDHTSNDSSLSDHSNSSSPLSLELGETRSALDYLTELDDEPSVLLENTLKASPNEEISSYESLSPDQKRPQAIRWQKAIKDVISSNKVTNALKASVESHPQIPRARYIKAIFNNIVNNSALLTDILNIGDTYFYEEDSFKAAIQSIKATGKLDSLRQTLGAIGTAAVIIKLNPHVSPFTQLVKDGALVELTNIPLRELKKLFEIALEHSFIQEIITHEITPTKFDCLKKIKQLNQRISKIRNIKQSLSQEENARLSHLKNLLKEQEKFAHKIGLKRIDRIIFDIRTDLGLKPDTKLDDLIIKGMPIIYAIISDEQNFSLLRKAATSYTSYILDKTDLQKLESAIVALVNLAYKDTMLPLLFDIDKLLTMQGMLSSDKPNKAKLVQSFFDFVDNREDVIIGAAMGENGFKKFIPKILKLPNIVEKLKLSELSSQQLKLLETLIIPIILDKSKPVIITLLKDHKVDLINLAKAYDNYKAIITQYPPAIRGEPEEALKLLLSEINSWWVLGSSATNYRKNCNM